MAKVKKPVKQEKPQRVIVIPPPKLFLGTWTMELINALPEADRYKKLIQLDEQLPADIRARWSVRDVAEFVGWANDTVNTMARMGYLPPDGTRNERGDKFWYPATVLRYLMNRIEREDAAIDKRLAAE